MRMTRTALGTKLLFSYRRMLLLAFVCVCFCVSCKNKETITDVYYICNNVEDTVFLNFSHSIYWDTCSVYSTESYSYIRFANEELAIPARSMARLHPVIRTLRDPGALQLYPIEIIGTKTKLIISTDTISWYCAYRDVPPLRDPSMFTSDTIWSIYNTESWQTIQSEELPYTFYHTFLVTRTDVERSIQ